MAGTHKPELTGSNPPGAGSFDRLCHGKHMSLSTITSPSFLESRAGPLLRPCQRPLRLAQPNRAMPCLPSRLRELMRLSLT